MNQNEFLRLICLKKSICEDLVCSSASPFGDRTASFIGFVYQGIFIDLQVFYSCADLVQFPTHMLLEVLEEVKQ